MEWSGCVSKSLERYENSIANSEKAFRDGLVSHLRKVFYQDLKTTFDDLWKDSENLPERLLERVVKYVWKTKE